MHKNNTASPVLWAVLALPVLYLAALLASGYKEGMTVFDLMGRFSELLGRPFAIHWTEHTLKFMLMALLYADGPAGVWFRRGPVPLHKGKPEAR